MQKINLLLILCLFSFLTGKAQKFEGGMFAGMTFCQVDGDTYSGYNRLGMLAGGYVKLPLNSKWSARIEMEYIMKGSVHNFNPNNPADTGVNYVNKTSYVQVPFLFEYNLETALASVNFPDYLRKIRVFGGVSAAVLLSHKEIRDYQIDPPGLPGFANLNFTMIFGLQYMVSPRLNIDYRWDNSVTSIRTGAYSGYIQRFGGPYGQYNNIMALSLFYKF